MLLVEYNTVLHTVQIELQISEICKVAELIIVNEDIQTLLGRIDAKALGVLRVGLKATKDIYVRIVPTVAREALSKLKDFQLQISIDKSVPPVIQPFRRIPFALRSRIEEQINELLRLDIIERVEGASVWVSPIVPVPKGPNGIRLCVDMRRANEAVLHEKHPIPVIEDVAPLLKDATVFSKVDLKQAYHQIELAPESREITTFGTHLGLFRYKRLMFGLKCAPEIFQRIVENILSGLKGVFNYLDDLLIFGRTPEEHDANLKAVLQRLSDVGFVINPGKCQFRKNEVTFLGHIIGSNSIRPMLDKVRAVKDFRSPQTAEELRSFIGLVSYLGRFIPHFSTELDLLQKVARRTPFEWTAEAEQTFVHVQSLLSEDTYLSLFDPELPTIVMADASPVRLGAVLMQKKNDQIRVICYVSRSLSPIERRYSQTEKEALALVFAVERLKMYLLGREFDLVTDHKPLQTIFGPRSKPCARLERWLLRIQGYKYRVIHVPGKNNIADPLSRLLPHTNIVTENDVYEKNLVMFVQNLVPRAITLKEIRKAIETDEVLQSVCRSLHSNRRITEKPFSALTDELCIVDNILLRGSRIVIPVSLRRQVLENAHEGHPGIVKIKERLRSKVWWPGIDREADTFVRTCDACQKIGKSITIQEMSRRTLPDGPWQDLAIDFKSLPSNKHLCVVVDYFSKFIECKVMKKTTAEATTKFLQEIFARFGYCYSITSDNGPPFNSEDFATFCKQLGIVHYTTPPYWAQANGEVERQNRSINKIIKIAVLKNEDYKKELRDYLLMYHSTPHSVTGVSPAELMFNRKLRDKIPTMKERIEVPGVRERDAFNKALSTERLRSDSVPDKSIEVGDEVLIKRPFNLQKSDSKFEGDTGIVTSVNGPMVSINTPSRSLKRHKNQVELYDRRPEVPEEQTEKTKEDQLPTATKGEDTPVTVSPRPVRIKQKPMWQKDFVLT